MGVMATTVMNHLEMTREVQEHRRGMKMSRGLASFVEGKAELVEAEVEAEDGEGTKIAGQFEMDMGIGASKSKVGSTRQSSLSNAGSIASIERREKEYSTALSKTEKALLVSQHHESEGTPTEMGSASQNTIHAGTSVSISSPSPALDNSHKIGSPDEEASEGSALKILFSRASNLIREAFEVDGAVFYDAQKGFSSEFQHKPPAGVPLSREDSQASGDDLSTITPSEKPPTQVGSMDSSSSSTKVKSTSGNSPRTGEGLFPRRPTDTKTVEMLGFSTPGASSVHGDEYPGPHSFVPFDEKSLNILLRRYPRGKLWTFDSDGSASSASDDEKYAKAHPSNPKDASRRRLKHQRNKKDGKFLLKHFPGVRQLLFVPLWDASRSRWLSGCCAWSTEPTRILSKQSELAFLTAFGNSVMAECSRIDTEIADQKKGDFIGSISHELRSPLHGILASAEFLSEEVGSGFEKGLVETIDSCGRTLLDTIVSLFNIAQLIH